MNTDSESLVKESSVVDKPEKLRFNATFRATPGNTYRVTLIYDKNTDGKFNDQSTTDDNNEVLYSTTIKAETRTRVCSLLHLLQLTSTECSRGESRLMKFPVTMLLTELYMMIIL